MSVAAFRRALWRICTTDFGISSNTALSGMGVSVVVFRQDVLIPPTHYVDSCIYGTRVIFQARGFVDGIGPRRTI